MLKNRHSSRPSKLEFDGNNSDVEVIDGEDEKFAKITSDDVRRLKSSFLKVLGISTLSCMSYFCLFSVWKSQISQLGSRRALNDVPQSSNNMFPLVVQLSEDSPQEETSEAKRLTFLSDLSMFTQPIYFRKGRNHRNVEPLTSFNDTEVLEDSSDYSDKGVDEFETDDCKAQYAWQMDSKPTCNAVHEIGMRISSSTLNTGSASVSLITHGDWRDVWSVQVNSQANHGKDLERVVLKTHRAQYLLTGSYLERNRMDSMAMEHLTVSPWILDIYSYCGSSGIYEYAPKGSLENIINGHEGLKRDNYLPLPPVPEFMRYGEFVF